jgi:hypothetical protein
VGHRDFDQRLLHQCLSEVLSAAKIKWSFDDSAILSMHLLKDLKF